jgi:hypothetical protein
LNQISALSNCVEYDGLNEKSFKEQYEYGKKLLDREMKKYEKDPKNY